MLGPLAVVGVLDIQRVKLVLSSKQTSAFGQGFVNHAKRADLVGILMAQRMDAGVTIQISRVLGVRRRRKR